MPKLIPAEPLTPAWHAARRLGVTATDIVTILGLSSWDSVYSLFWRKLGQVPEVEDSDRMRLGRELESYVAERWAENTGTLIRKAPGMYAKPVLRDGGLYQSNDRLWQLATLDRIRYEGRGDISEPVELKTWADADRRSWDTAPPAQVRAQVLWQMDVMDVATGHVGVVFLPSGEFRSYVIEHDESPVKEYPHDVPGPLATSICRVCDDLALMRREADVFMARLRLELPPPDPDSSAATLAAVRARFSRQPDKQAEVDGDDWADFQRATEEVNRWTTAKREVEIELREQAGEASVYTVDGVPVARRVTSEAHVKAHVRQQDYLKRIKQGDDDV